MEKKYTLLSNIKYMFNLSMRYCRSNISSTILIGFAMAGTSVLELFITPIMVGLLESGESLSKILWALGFFILAFLLMGLIQNYYNMTKVIRGVTIRMQVINAMVKKFSNMSYPLTLDNKVLSMKEKAQYALDSNTSAIEGIWVELSKLIHYTVTLAVCIILLSKLPIWIVIFTLVSSYISYIYSKKLKEWRYKNREQENKIISKHNYLERISSDYKYGKDIRLFGLKTWLDDLHRVFNNLYSDFLKKVSIQFFMADLLDLVFTLMRNGITYYYLINLVLGGEIMATEFLVFFNSQSILASDIQVFFETLTTLNLFGKDISVVREFLDYPEPFKLKGGQRIKERSPENLSIELKNVSYKYPNSDEYILKNINLKINPKDKIAIVGMNGAGKTTLIKLIIGYLDPTDGQVLINGKDIKDFNRLDYYSLFSAVFQEYHILPETIWLNIVQDFNLLDEKSVWEAVNKAGLEEDIKKMPAGLETHISKEIYYDGIDLSGGQTQKLLLARAIYKKAPFLVLDEPTAALDPIAEKKLYTKYNELTKDSTSIFISHRLASTRFCDYILFIENGEISEKGSHEELIALEGRYSYLFNVQSQYYKEEENEGKR